MGNCPLCLPISCLQKALSLTAKSKIKPVPTGKMCCVHLILILTRSLQISANTLIFCGNVAHKPSTWRGPHTTSQLSGAILQNNAIVFKAHVASCPMPECGTLLQSRDRLRHKLKHKHKHWRQNKSRSNLFFSCLIISKNGDLLNQTEQIEIFENILS